MFSQKDFDENRIYCKMQETGHGLFSDVIPSPIVLSLHVSIIFLLCLILIALLLFLVILVGIKIYKYTLLLLCHITHMV